MNKLKYICLLMLLTIVAVPAAAQGTESNAVITLERTACHGNCPVYTVTILADGTVMYEGTDFVSVTGEQSSAIAPETVAAMVEAFQNAGYFEWNKAYETQAVSDLATITTSVTRSGSTHTIVRYAGDPSAPLALPFLEQWIDVMSNTALWTGVTPDISTISNGTDTPLVTLQHEPNFGLGPVYNVAAYADGKVIFMGIANVTEIGVQVVETDAAIITGIAQIAQLFGYFDWQDSYEERIMTDQATIITSIRWEDQFKRIVRYDGDPNAPIGLVRIEGNIDQLVTDLVS